MQVSSLPLFRIVNRQTFSTSPLSSAARVSGHFYSGALGSSYPYTVPLSGTTVPFCASTLVLTPSTRSFSFRRSFSSSTPSLFSASPSSSPSSSPRSNALLTAIKQIESQFGKGSVMKLGSPSAAGTIVPMTEIIPTGSLSLDHALGIGGIPRGRICEFYGDTGSGKTTLSLMCIAQAQKKGLTCVFIDAEHSLSPEFAAVLGVDLEKLYITQPDTGEMALEVADTLIRSGGIDLVVIDSVSALVPKAELEGEMGDSHIGLQARLMSQALRKLTASLARSKTSIIFINQIRSKIGVIFGNPEVTSGGNALKFYSSMRCEVRRASIIKEKGGNSKDGERAIGNVVRVKVSKNKLAPPLKIAEFELMYGHGISRAGEALDIGIQCNIVKLSGSFYSITNEKIVADMNKAIEKDANEQHQKSSGNGAKAIIVSTTPTAASLPPQKTKKGKKGSKKGANEDTVVAVEVPATVVDSSASIASMPTTTTDASASSSSTNDAKTGSTGPSSVSSVTFPILAVDEHFAQGKEKARQFLDAYPSAREVLYEAVRKELFSKNIALPVSGDGND